MKVYAIKHNNERIRIHSRSGGVFTALSDRFLDGGIIYGCVLNADFDAIHIRTDNSFIRDKMRGSKYIQSNLGDIFIQVKNDLNDNKSVLFTGTSCQVAGLKGFLRREYENLYCVDILCHGVPSPKVWHKYLEWISQGNTITNVDFRNKMDYGWEAHVETITVGEQKINSEVFKNLFLGNNILRPSCYECPYKSIHHPGDITIADYWGIDNVFADFNDNKGVSLVLTNTEKGNSLFELAKSDIEWKETTIENAMQPALIAPSQRPKGRDHFWKEFNNNDFSLIVNKYGIPPKSSLIRRFASKLKYYLKKLL